MDALQKRLADVDPANEAAVRRGWGNYFGENPDEALMRAGSSGAEVAEIYADISDQEEGSGDDDEPLDDIQPSTNDRKQLAQRMLELFVGREDAHAVHRLHEGKVRVLPCAGSLTETKLCDHLAGKTTCALYPLCNDGSVRLVVVDIDADQKAPAADMARERAGEFALAFAQVADVHGLTAAIEDSGGKGYHAWLFFAEAIPAETARKLARLLVADTAAPRTDLRVEIFPRHSEWPGPDLGDCIKVPFGVHMGTGRRTLLLDEEGEPMQI